ncbi:MAG: Uncharacterized protein G01um101425_205 [Candidatus Peregrinibacteria bacterium Gr01-1014_25]|nr:MAG: Uncharacterized protein G01um101425_205 [Candidatus Peregrinibacteria bacterium Gr01-1014_25]
MQSGIGITDLLKGDVKTIYRKEALARVYWWPRARWHSCARRAPFLFLPFRMVQHFLSRNARKGFTLIELLLVIGIIAILAAIVIVAINPTKQLADARNAQRRSDVNTILNAVYQYSIDNTGNLPSTITTTTKEICESKADCDSDGIHLDMLTGTYLVSLPTDPRAASTATGTDYTIVKTSGGRVTVSAPQAEQSQTIQVTR